MHPGDAATPVRTGRALTTANVVADHAGYNRGTARLAPTLLRSRAVSGREILAHVVSGGRLTAGELDMLAEREDRDGLIRTLDPRTVGTYARVLAHQLGPAGQEGAALEIFRSLVTVHGWEALGPVNLRLYAQLLGKFRRRDELLELLAITAEAAEPEVGLRRDIAAALRADLHNPFLYPADGETRFLELFNTAIDPEAEPAVTLRATGLTPFDRLAPADLRRRTDGPLITVVTSAYNPDHALLGAARSLVGQTWTSWEMLIVDDASTEPASLAVLREAEALDPRIRVIRKAVNGGTYRARNTALMQARGAFMTFLDSDDWAHPERLEAGVLPMLEDPRLMATRSYGARVTEDLELTRPGYGTRFPTAASLMFRIPEVPARIGFFDTARKAADTEYSRRIESAFRQKVREVKGRALTLVRRAEGTLSAGEFSWGWRHQSRWAYQQAYRYAHGLIAEGEAAYREPHEPSPHFGAHWWARPGDPEDRLDRRFDVVLAGDWRRFGGPQVSMIEEIRALRAGGLRVGVMHLEAMRFRTDEDQPLCRPLRELLHEDVVELVFPDDDVEIDLLILRYPPILQFPPVVPGTVRPRKLFIMANQAPCEPDGSDQRYVPRDVHRHGTEMFGTEPRWIPQGPVIRDILEPLLPAGALTTWDNPGIIDRTAWLSRRTRPDRERPVVGRFSRDDRIKFPATGHDLLAAYGLPDHFEVRMMGASRQVGRLLGGIGVEIPSNWTVLPHGAMDAREFVRGVDVVVYVDHPDAHEAFGRVLLESAASGALVIAAPKHRATFGDALVYAEPAEVHSVLTRYLDDPELFRSQVRHTLSRVAERWSYEAFRRRIRGELAHVDLRAGRAPRGARPAGAVTLRRRGSDGRLVVDSPGGDLAAHVAPLRRPADAELVDSVAVVHERGAEPDAARLAQRIQSRHRPGTSPRALDEPLPAGVHALVHHADGEWGVRVAAGGRVRTTPAECRVSFAER